MTGWILLHRRFLEWEWYDDINTKVVFLHCLLRANFEDKKYQGMIIKRGQFVTGRDKFAKEVSLSPQKIRTCWDKLKSTGEITVKSTNAGSIVTVCNYNTYQDKPKKNNQRITNDQPTDNQRITTIKEGKELKEGKEQTYIHPICSDLTNVSGMDEPLTVEQGDKLISEFGESVVSETLLQMENYKPLRKKSKSANLTVRNWIKRNQENSKKYGMEILT